MVEFSDQVIRKRRSPASPLSIINAYVYGKGKNHKGLIIAGLPICSVNKQHCKEVVFSVLEHSESMALELFHLLNQFMGWAERQKYIERTPIVSSDKKDWSLKKTSKITYLFDINPQGDPVSGLPEIKHFFHVLDNEYRDDVGISFKLLLLTGTISGEFRKAKKESINLDELTWYIPKEDTKTWKPENNRDTSIIIPLTEYTALLFRKLMDLSDTDMVVNYGRTLLSENMKNIVKKYNYPYRTPKTLRKTFRSHIIGWCTYDVAEKCLNHSLGHMAQTYDKNALIDKRRKALNLWSDKVYRACYSSENNIVQIDA
jgi:integrase